MEANNHFNYGTHSSVAANSGLKLSSGDSLYTNGSSMSFPQQGKNLNGEMNVNGITTVIGPSVPGPHPPTASYPHMSNHHQGSMGYDYLWGAQPQYSPAMGSSPGHGMHQKQPSPAVMQQQNQHHFQGHGQYQLNGGMPGSHQPPVAAPPNVTLTGGQYWNRANPGQQQSGAAMALGYNSHGVYGAYQSQVHPGIVPSQQHLHQQQPQQPPQPPAHQQTPQHVHPHLHPHHHHQQRQQQPQHYGMVPNGMPYYQAQHPPLPATQPPSQPQSQAQMMPPTSQNFTPPRGSPQHHHMGRAGTSSPLPAGVSSAPMMSPSSVTDSGSPQSQTRERSPQGGSVAMPAVMQGRMSEAFKDVDIGFNGLERASVAQQLLKSDSYPHKPPGPPMGSAGDYFQCSEPPMAPHHEMTSLARESVLPTPPHSIPSPPPAVSAPPSVVSTPPRVSATPAGSKPLMGASGPPVVSSSVTSTPPGNSASPMSSAPSPPVVGPPPRLSSPPLMVQGLRPSVTASTSPSMASPASVSAPPSKPLVPPLPDTSSKSPAASVPHPGSAPTSVSVACQITPVTSAPPAMISNTTMGSAPTHSMSTPMSALQYMVQGTRPPPLTSSPPALSGVPKEQFWTPSISEAAPPRTISGSPPAVSAPSVAASAACTAVTRAPPAVSAPSVSESSPLLVSSPPPVVTAPSAVSESAVSSSKEFATSVTVHVGEALPVAGPPTLTPQAYKCSTVSEPPSLVSVRSAPLHAPKRMVPLKERDMEDKKDPSVELQPKADTVRTSSTTDPTQSLTSQSEKHSYKPLADVHVTTTRLKNQENSSWEINSAEKTDNAPIRGTDTPLERRVLKDTCRMEESEDEESADESSQALSTHPDSTRMEDTSLTEENDSCNDSSLKDSSQFGDTSRLDDSSRMDDTSRLDDSSHVDCDTSQFDNTSLTDDDSRLDINSQFDKSSCIDDKSRFYVTSRLDENSHMGDDSGAVETSDVGNTGMESSFSSVEDSRDLTLDGTKTEESTWEEETFNSCLSTRSILESSLNNTSQLDDSHGDLYQNKVSRSSSNGHVKPPPAYKGPEGAHELEGQDVPDIAGSTSTNSSAASIMTPPVVMDKDKHTAALSALVESLVATPLLPLAAPNVPITGEKIKTPRKPRKPRTPAASTPVSQDPGQAQRKSAVKTPKVEKIKMEKIKVEKLKVERKKKPVEKGEVTAKKEKGPPRKRKKKIEPVAVTVEAKQSAEGLLPGQSEPIATISETCLTSSETPTVTKPKKVRIKKAKNLELKPPKMAKMDIDTKPNDDDINDNDGDDSSTAGDTPRRRVATEEQVHFPLLHGWKREIRVKKSEDRLKGETWYYSPCGRRMKQFPEVIKYLNRHQDTAVTREHFSFSPRMPVGDFYEERDTAEGVRWCLLANEEVPSIIMAITGRRGRPPNPDKEKPRPRVRRTKGSPVRKPGRPPKPKMVDLLSKVDARILKRLEAKEALTEEDKEKLVKIKKKMKRKARMKRKEDNKNKKIRQEKKQAKLDLSKETKDQEEVKMEPGDKEPPLSALPQPALSLSALPQPTLPQPDTTEPKKRGPRKKKVEVPPAVVETDQERVAQGKRVLGARSKAKALAKAQAEAEAVAQAALVAKKQAERRAQAQRRLEERKRQQMIMEELKKPTEDMCLTDHRPLPELSRIPGVVLSGVAFSHCLAVVEFLHSYGKVLGLHIPQDVPSLSTLQEGLLGLGDSQGEVQDLLIKLVEAALHDPGLPSYYQSVKILGEKLADVELTRSTVSEGLRIFLESHGFDMEVCNVLRTKTFHALSPDTKAAILAFLVEELNGSNIVISEIDNTLENMATYRKNKWIIEGKLRRLKAALARRTGRSEDELCLEERRRSSRVADEDNLSMEEGGPMERGSRRRTPKEEPKLSDTDSPTNASVPELERQIDKLTKRQVFFRKKLLQSSHSLRAVSLGQDRFRRRYWVLPHLGGVLVEGPEEILASEDILVKEVPITLLKREPKVEETPTPITPPAPVLTPPPSQSQTTSPTEEDPLPGTASLMSSPRARGRPRKIKPEVELHLRTAKCRRRRRSSKSVGEEAGPGVTQKTISNGMQDLTQSAFRNWLSQSQGSVPEGVEPAVAGAPEGSQPEDSVKEMAEKHGQWFNLLPKQPCDDTSLTEPLTPSGTPPKRLTLTPSSLPALAAPLLQSVPAPSDQPAHVTPTTTPAKPVRRRRRGSRGSSPARRIGGRGAAAKRRGRPPTTLFQEIEQQYFTQLVVKPIPASMVRGWWWIKEPDELTATLQALHPRGIREKVLHKHLAKHMEYLAEVCTRPINDPIFQVMVKEGETLLESIQQPWQVQERALETDVSALCWVEDLEQRVIAADLHLKMAPQNGRSDTDNSTETADAGFQPYTVPEADSTRDDLQYYEHDADPRDDWIVRTKKEWSDLPRVATHPLDLAVLRLANLERNIDRRYLKEPLWNLAEVVRLAPLTLEESQMGQMDVISLESEITPRLRTWRQALDRCRSAPQLCLCLLQLEKAIAWERSVVKVTCQVCRKGDNDEYLLLCDGCDRGCHMYCLRPKVTQVPEGDWFCPTCVSKASDGESQRGSQRSYKQRTRVKKRRYEDDSSDEETAPCRRSGTRHPGPASSSSSRYSGDWGGGTGFSPAKRRRMTTRNQPDLTYCEIILMEMESHPDAWPFLEPVNPRMVPGYRRIIKNPMDFLTMRERLLQGGYCSCEEFAADAHLVFNNCEQFNEDTSEVGMAGHSMKRFFENRWAEFYESKDK
ncbi:LOW QUALITY PROTEIN: bromodomain adjacent to zinc finger domain protein 2A [Esox lucius]|uniref:LOW QUALITY PROTEIN: bromodomain adjacent to zinc finger domain protein 2A n=1 Tax=Esox lucius TaxID=8010 RepID=UPI0014776D87|nr:LOW QUALITY PROTEIN: bromodomain adjacent to zinc finger domain protein 2A [Esox lucius]